MPGHSDSQSAWGQLPLVVDTSAWSRAHQSHVKDAWKQALLEDRMRISPLVRFEILTGARSGRTFDELTDELSTWRAAPLTATVLRAAHDAMRTLAHRSSGAQRLPIVDYLVAAAAQEIGAAVLHYDSDYDTLAEIMEFESIWLASPGSLA
ncbi:MAG: PIN domain-containing protein [Thermoleophilaceae bacterium]